MPREIDRLFTEFVGGFDMEPLKEFSFMKLPEFNTRLDIAETEKEMKVTAELPGMRENDRKRNRFEESYETFERSVVLPSMPEMDKIKAEFKKGTLTVILPKHKEEHETRKMIHVRAA
jgi:HSP20 family protein